MSKTEWMFMSQPVMMGRLGGLYLQQKGKKMYCTRMKCFFDKKPNFKLELNLPTDIQNIIEDYKRGFEKVEYNWYKIFRSLSGYQLATVRDTLHIDDLFDFKTTIPRVLASFPKKSRIYHKALKALIY